MQPAAGIPAITGWLLSIFMLTEIEFEIPAPFLAKHVTVTPGTSATKVLGSQPEVDAIPDWGSLTLQRTVTLLRYQPLEPSVPDMSGVMAGGEVSGCSETIAARTTIP